MSLARTAVRGVAWSMVLAIASRAIGLVGTVVLTRHLAPEAIGEVQVALVLVTTANTLSLLGLGHYVVARPDGAQHATFPATVICLATGALALGVTVLVGGALAPRFDAPGAASHLPGLALAVALDRVAFIPSRILVRDLRFRAASLVRTAGEAVFPCVAVGLALQGRGAQALVAANLARALVRAVATVALVHPRLWLAPCRIGREGMRRILSFALPNGLAGIAGFAATHWDNLLMARMFGPTELGHYQLAHNLSALPSNQVGEHVGDVLLPSFARLPPERRGPALARSVRLLGLLMFPLSIGLGVTATTIARCFLSPAWEPVGPRVAVLAALSAAYPIGFVAHSFLNAAGHPRWVMKLGVGRAAALFSAMALLGHMGGPLWACAGIGIAFGGYAVAAVAVAARIAKVAATALLAALAPILAACAPMVAAVLGARAALHALGVEGAALFLAAEVLAGAAAFVAAALVAAPGTSRELADLVSRAWGRSPRRGLAR